ncbi:forkhead box protein I1-A-like isoform X1 [Mizuhopecten yessoensis]|uniref:Forkhead box protein N4 n=1 Tax=Mizuhopecten yessoensis TaxID=6573 RepID=A0A210PYW7_MIZYE|nr:forkhead box protein I1-A-like isoform X1 [Mizuhopecten yessoensis]OWF41672.1 Forkhead box protein N4 [Mizuhopecten yessoensis]
MLSMAFCNTSDMDFLDTIPMAMDSSSYDLQNEVDKILQGSDKFQDYSILNNDSNHGNFDFETNNQSVDDWIQNIQCQWNDVDVVKLQNSLLDSSFEVENNNPNLLVNPQTGLPVNHFSPRKQLSSSTTVKSESGQSSLLADSPHFTLQTDHNLNCATRESNTTSSDQSRFSNVNNNAHIQPVKSVLSSPSHNSPVLVNHLQQGLNGRQVTVTQNNVKKSVTVLKSDNSDRAFPKPVYSYSCLIAMSLKNSRNGSLPVSEIYTFMTEHFPYFKTAPDGWKNSVRHNLSLNKCFAKVETPKVTGNNSKKGCLWALNPDKVEKMEDEIAKHRKKDLDAIRNSMAMPEKLELIEAGKAGPAGSRSEGERILSLPVTTTPSTTTARVVKISTPVDSSIKQEDYLHSIVLDGSLSLDNPLPDLTLQNGIWDDLSTDMELPLTTSSTLSLNASPLTIQSVVSLAGVSGAFQGQFTCSSSPMLTLTQNATVAPACRTPSKILEAQI